DACYLCAIESVPSEVRTSALGTFSLVARIGALLAPVLGLLSSEWPYAPYLIISGLGMLNLAMSCIYLPETKGKDLFHVKPKLHHFEEDEQNGYDMEILNSKS
uniref:Major facilitator superfamily (MFS) profile domain-containing protein n=1 Tax=Acrobeloides nanus TaxID=290746 RepID=A0A914DD08_9BILA